MLRPIWCANFFRFYSTRLFQSTLTYNGTRYDKYTYAAKSFYVSQKRRMACEKRKRRRILSHTDGSIALKARQRCNVFFQFANIQIDVLQWTNIIEMCHIKSRHFYDIVSNAILSKLFERAYSINLFCVFLSKEVAIVSLTLHSW